MIRLTMEALGSMAETENGKCESPFAIKIGETLSGKRRGVELGVGSWTRS
jgi:hypothetical protein